MTTTVKISGYSRNEGVREFEILDRKELESIIDELDQAEIYRKTFEKAIKHKGTSGYAYTYISAIDGKIGTVWLQQRRSVEKPSTRTQCRYCGEHENTSG